MQVAYAPAVDHVYALGHLDVSRVRVLIAGQAEVKPPTVALLVEPELARGIQVLRFIFQVILAAADDLVGWFATPLPGERERSLLAVHCQNPGRERVAHHPALGGPDDGALVVVLRLVGIDLLVIERQMPPLTVDGCIVVKRLVGVLPRPPLALDVVRVGDVPVRRSGQGNARHRALLAHHPDVPRRPIEIHVPDLLRLRDECVVGPLLPTRHRLRAANDGRPRAP